MSRASRWFALAGVVAAAVLAAPSLALAGDCNGSSAVNIYNQGSCLPSAKGSHTGGSKKKPKSNPVQVITPPPVSPQTSKVINTSGKDKPILTKLVTDPRIRAPHLAPTLLSASAGTTSVGSEFNLGSGPTILLALLAATIVLLLGAGGLRAVRERHRS